jgi:hypothetical protein
MSALRIPNGRAVSACRSGSYSARSRSTSCSSSSVRMMFGISDRLFHDDGACLVVVAIAVFVGRLVAYPGDYAPPSLYVARAGVGHHLSHACLYVVE